MPGVEFTRNSVWSDIGTGRSDRKVTHHLGLTAGDLYLLLRRRWGFKAYLVAMGMLPDNLDSMFPAWAI